MLKLKQYSFSGIGRFVEKQTIDLENRDHLIQIDGENLNTGGSSGAGKSTTVEALAYLLGISDISATQLQSRITKSPIYVKGEFEDGITITRSKKDGLTIETPEGTVSGNSKLAEEKLDEIIGVSRNLLKTMCYKRQKQGGFFLNLTPKESHSFLIECLGLKEYHGKIFKLEDMLKNQYKPRKIELDSAIKVQTESISQLNALLNEKKIPLRPELAYLDQQEARLSIIQINLKAMEESYMGRIQILGAAPQQINAEFTKQDVLDGFLENIFLTKKLIEENRTLYQTGMEQVSSAILKIESKIKRCDENVTLMDKLTQSIDSLNKELEHIEEGNCPTCSQKWEEGVSKKKESITRDIEVNRKLFSEYQNELENKPHHLVLLAKAKELHKTRKNTPVNVEEEIKLDKLQSGARVLENERDNVDNVAKQEYLEKLAKYQDAKNLLDMGYQQQTREQREEEVSLTLKIKETQIEVKAYNDAMEVYKRDYNNINDKLHIAISSLDDNKTELEQLDRDIVLSEESIRLIKNYTLQKFQDTLDYIGERATEIINNVPNMTNAVIFFDNAKETKSGKIKNEVNAVLNLEGDVKVPIKTLSGGERTSADFAIDLAVSEMIESMTQKGVNFLIIDEGFDGLDSISKIECLEILKNLNTDKKILIVDHSSEVKEMVSDIIRVRRINEESCIA